MGGGGGRGGTLVLRTLALCSFKGGTGKTTLAFNLAERAWQRGLAVALVDCDPQRGAVEVMDLRRAEKWPCWTAEVSLKGARELAALKGEGGYDLVIFDMPGFDSVALISFLREMDLILSPVSGSAQDVLSAANFWEVAEPVNGAGTAFVANNMPVGKSRREGMTADLTALVGEVCPVYMQRRVAHSDALREGLGVCEAAGKSAAAAEVEALWQWVAGRLEIPVWQGA